MNFGIVIGAVAAQIAVILVVYWGFGGFGGIAFERPDRYPTRSPVWATWLANSSTE